LFRRAQLHVSTRLSISQNASKDSDRPVVDANQAEYQFVIEIPGFTPLPNSPTDPVGIHGKTGRAHDYNLRSD